MKPYFKKGLVIVLLVVIYISVIIPFIDYRARVKYLRTSYSGAIQNIRKGDRGTIEVELNNEWINLGLHVEEPGVSLELGDSLVKKKDSNEIVFYKKISPDGYLIKTFK